MRTKRARSFHLSKWYADCISEDGETFIGYWAQLRWGLLDLRYQNLLHYREPAGTCTDFSLRRSSPPHIDGSAIHWVCPAIHLEGNWESVDPRIQATVFESDLGSVQWNCFQPRANARIVMDNRSRQIAGYGYVERLDLSIPPWRLPIDELHWGRFTSPTDSLVWIDWRGPHSTRLAFRNGRPSRAVSIDTHALTLEDGSKLRLDSSRLLRGGSLGSTVLSAIEGVAKLFPTRILNIVERKWRSRATLELPGRRAVTGWAIHEVVQWP